MICVHCETQLPDTAKFCTECGGDPSNPGTSGPAKQQSIGVSSLHDMLREVLGTRYDVGGMLGRGGMGAVFKALDKSLDREVAVKVLPPEYAHDDKFVGRFEREARTAAKLDHPGIIPIYAVEHSDQLYYFVMKYVPGRSLDEILKSGAMPIDTCQRILWESACALGHAHQRGVVHRDIKPGNIMVDETGRVILMDFGISKASQAATQFTATGQVIGTPHYMSPEQAKGLEVDGRSDLYSLGVVGYRMLSGRLPFADDSVHTIIYKHIFEDPAPVEDFRPDTPPFLATAIRRALAKDPNDRFGTMEAFASAVLPDQPVAGPSGVVAIPSNVPSSTDAATQITPPTPSTRALRQSARAATERKRSPVLAILGTVILLGGGGYGAWWMWSSQSGAAAGAASGSDSLLQPIAVSVLDSAAGSGSPPDSEPVAAGGATGTTATTDPPQQTPPRPAPQQPVQQTPVQQAPAPPRVGYISINAEPFGRVVVDGVELGDTPVVNHELTPGRHIIEIRREGFQLIRDTVTVVAGNTFRRTYTLIREPER